MCRTDRLMDISQQVVMSVISPGGYSVQCDLITSYLHMKADKTKVPVT